MITLGIAISHNSSAALMIDGEIKGMIQEERLTKIKKSSWISFKSYKNIN